MDLEALLAPVTPEDPSGPDLEYDPAFGEIDRLAQGKPEQQIGNTIVPAEAPDWKVVQKKATELLARSKDLRVGAHLTRALLHTSGWAGFAIGLGVLRGLIERYWDGVHPRLDPSDDNDPTMRVNVLSSFGELGTLSAVRALPLVSSRTLGRVSLKDLEMAAGDAPAPANGAPSMANIEGAVMDSDLGELQQTVTALRACLEALAGIEAAVGERVDASAGTSFGKLPVLLRKAESFLGSRLEQRSGAGAPGADGAGASGASNGAAPQRSFGGAINSREDVIRALDAICSYYAKNEPSSPIPMFMERSKKLVMMSFVDIVKELVPDALSRVDILRGQAEGG
ncbi:MAG TPA: type VI secretion system protein TssA [Polyangia bacterium]|nr:type VI secretion system protein TssA [Polyangia bacterium]